jgi:TolB-like protein
VYALAFVAAAILSKAAIVGIGLPDWVFPGAIIVMALGLPVILFTAFVHHGAHQALTTSALTPGGSPVMHSTMTRLALIASPWVSWRKTATGGFIAMGVFAAAVVAFMILRALGIGPAGSLLAAGKFGTKDNVLVADFRVRGVDSTIGSVITEAVRTDLAQSSVVSVVPPSTVAAALVRMERPETSHVDLTLAREIAARQGVKAIVDGEVAPLGSGWLLTLRLITAESGAPLASFRGTADSPRDLLPTLDKMTRQLREDRGIAQGGACEPATRGSDDQLARRSENTSPACERTTGKATFQKPLHCCNKQSPWTRRSPWRTGSSGSRFPTTTYLRTR